MFLTGRRTQVARITREERIRRFKHAAPGCWWRSNSQAEKRETALGGYIYRRILSVEKDETGIDRVHWDGQSHTTNNLSTNLNLLLSSRNYTPVEAPPQEWLEQVEQVKSAIRGLLERGLRERPGIFR